MNAAKPKVYTFTIYNTTFMVSLWNFCINFDGGEVDVVLRESHYEVPLKSSNLLR